MNLQLSNPGQYFDAESGLHQNYFRDYDPRTGRYIEPDPIGLAGGMNLFGYVASNPLRFIDPNGLTLTTNVNFFLEWVFGREPRIRNYGPKDVETQEMMVSSGAELIRDLFYKKGCKNVTNVAYGSGHAYKDTISNPFGSPFQVGGFAGASATNNGNGTVTFYIPNVAGTHSFFYHRVPNISSPTGPISNIYQYFQWTEPIDSNRCGCE